MPDHRIQIRFHTSLVRVEDYCCAGSQAAHDEEAAFDHEIVFVRRGLFVRRDASGTVLSDASQIVFFQRGQPYHISHPIPGGDYSTLFALNDDTLLDLLRVHEPSVADHPDRPFPAAAIPVDSRHRLLQYHLFNTLSGGDSLAAEEHILLLLAQVMAYVYRLTGKGRQPSRLPPSHRELADAVKLVLAARFRDRLQLNDIAGAVHYSPYFLCRAFKQATGLTIHAYLQRIRLFHALETLAEGRDTELARLALDLGFASHSHFSTAFQREFSLTPSQFRRTASGRSLRQLSKILKV